MEGDGRGRVEGGVRGQWTQAARYHTNPDGPLSGDLRFITVTYVCYTTLSPCEWPLLASHWFRAQLECISLLLRPLGASTLPASPGRLPHWHMPWPWAPFGSSGPASHSDP